MVTQKERLGLPSLDENALASVNYRLIVLSVWEKNPTTGLYNKGDIDDCVPLFALFKNIQILLVLISPTIKQTDSQG